MNCCGKRCINIITLIITIIIFIQTSLLTIIIINLKNNSLEISTKNIEQKIGNENNNKQSYEATSEEWKLIIPKIDVSAKIEEGTTGEVINNYIGHFSETPKENGNIGLIAASAGYKENYFKDLKNLTTGDVIIYVKGDIKKEYKVISNVAISQTDWSYLSNTKEDKITLITGILEEPDKRRCVQAIEVI